MPEIPAETAQELKRLRAAVAQYENTTTWFTTCHGCANLLDRCYEADRRAEMAEVTLALRTCLVPGCLHQYDAIAAMSGQQPARPEWSSQGWRILKSGMAFPAGGHICPDHVEPVLAHLPRRGETEPGWVQAVCSCGQWESPRKRWHGVVRALWEEHLLADVLHAWGKAGPALEQSGGSDG